jgi:CIC family chloride channel protein
VWSWVKPAIGGLAVGTIGISIPHVFGVGYETINSALWGSIEVELLLLILVGKMLATALSLGSGGSGGIFAPSLLLGAVLGAAAGNIAHAVFPDWTATSGAYALVGMGAVVAGVTHAPISAILIIFELTNNYLIIPPLMLSCIASLLVSNYLCARSIYVAKLESRGVKLYDKKDVNLLRAVKVRDVMDDSPVLLPAGTQFSVIITTLLSGKTHYAIVVDDKNRYVGTIELNDIREVLQDYQELSSLVIAQDVANTTVPYVLAKDNLDLAMHIFGKTDKDLLAVCENARTKKVIAVVTKSAVINAYNLRILQEDLTGGVGTIIDTVAEGQSVEIMGGMHLGKIEIPASWSGKSLQQLDLRRKHGLEIVVIHREKDQTKPDQNPGLFPSADLKLQAGDKLLVLSTPENIRKRQRS